MFLFSFVFFFFLFNLLFYFCFLLRGGGDKKKTKDGSSEQTVQISENISQRASGIFHQQCITPKTLSLRLSERGWGGASPFQSCMHF